MEIRFAHAVGWVRVVRFLAHKKYLLGFSYTVNDNMVYLERLPGSHRKLLDSFPITSVLEVDGVEEMRKKHLEIKNTMDLTLDTRDLKKVAYY